MENYGFVYIWRDRKHNRYYIGSHWGHVDDGYVCSSSWMKKSYGRRPEDFRRRILSFIYTNRKDMFDKEAEWQSMIKDHELKGPRYYNISRHGDNHWSSDPMKYISVSEKISNIIKNKLIDDIEYIEKQRIANLNKIGTKDSEETKKKKSSSIKKFYETYVWPDEVIEKRRKHSKWMIENGISGMKGKIHSEETKIKMSKSAKGMTGMRWYNDGKKTYQYTRGQQENLSFEDFIKSNPQFVPGRIDINITKEFTN